MRAAAEAAADIPTKASPMGAAKAEAAANLVAKVSAKATAEASTMGAVEAEAAANLPNRASTRAAPWVYRESLKLGFCWRGPHFLGFRNFFKDPQKSNSNAPRTPP